MGHEKGGMAWPNKICFIVGRRAYDQNEIHGDAWDKTPHYAGRNELDYNPQTGSGCL
jgi:hypothetical protein